MLSTDGQGNDRPPGILRTVHLGLHFKVSYQGKNKNNCACMPAGCLLASLLALPGEESHSPGVTKVHGAAQDLFLNFSRVIPKEFKPGL